ncbi:hypothetical protein HPB52_018436 [Rhipicephalus sanguineus]|uniref:Uncharacterized protein n=1 Tax=Rhipicephalus sanguineus TaxID=34632 RepID=A0A9D4PXD0_RHISA|nr:hypothetical protein HPB52_018436 [Rhipicephalus sanguineus]
MKEHFARLVQEHDRLQVKYGRLRAHLVERECRKEQQQPGPKGPLAPIPEDEADSPDGELPPCVRDSPLLMGLHLEAQRLQQELRRAQRAYWDLAPLKLHFTDPKAVVFKAPRAPTLGIAYGL